MCFFRLTDKNNFKLYFLFPKLWHFHSLHFAPAWHSSRIHLAEMHLIFFHPLASFFMISLDGSIPANAEKIKLERRRNKFEFKSDGKECTLHIASEQWNVNTFLAVVACVHVGELMKVD